jgi:hypothetical protein
MKEGPLRKDQVIKLIKDGIALFSNFSSLLSFDINITFYA